MVLKYVTKSMFGLLILQQMVLPIHVYAGASGAPNKSVTRGVASTDELMQFLRDDLDHADEDIRERIIEIEELLNRLDILRDKNASSKPLTMVTVPAAAFASILAASQMGKDRLSRLVMSMSFVLVASGAYTFELSKKNYNDFKELVQLVRARLDELHTRQSKVREILQKEMNPIVRRFVISVIYEREWKINELRTNLYDLRLQLNDAQLKDGVLQIFQMPLYLVGTATLISSVSHMRAKKLPSRFFMPGLGVSGVLLSNAVVNSKISAQDKKILEEKIELLESTITDELEWIKNIKERI